MNRLVENTIWSQRSNFIEVPTDCPQRDERLGWTGDAQVFAATACYLHDSHDFLRKWLRDVMADQRENGAIPHVSPDPTRLHPDKYRASSARPAGETRSASCHGTLAALRRPRGARGDAAGHGALGRFRLVDQRRADRAAARDLGRARLHVRRLAAARRDRAKSRCRTIGDDAAATIYLYISSTLTAKVANVLGDEVTAKRMSERAATVKAGLRARVHHAVRPSGLRRSDVLCARHSQRPCSGRHCCCEQLATSRLPLLAPTAGSAPASSARPRSCRPC